MLRAFRLNLHVCSVNNDKTECEIYFSWAQTIDKSVEFMYAYVKQTNELDFPGAYVTMKMRFIVHLKKRSKKKQLKM